ncbi:MAG: membrane protein insertase YidC [Saprospiraceae bacterium]
MDRNTIVGFLLIFGVMLLWTQLSAPSAEQIAEQQLQDSLAQVAITPEAIQAAATPATYVPDTSAQGVAIANSTFGAFAPRPTTKSSDYVLENDLLKLTFSSLGGRITQAEVKTYDKLADGENKEEIRTKVLLLEDAANEWSYKLPATGAAGGYVNTGSLPFEVQQSGNALTFTAPAAGGGYFQQRYTLGEDYTIDYAVTTSGLSAATGAIEALELKWVNYLDKIEKNVQYEQQNSLTYWKELDDNPDYVAAAGEDSEISDGRVVWVSNTNQFFNTSIVATDVPFASATMKSAVEAEESVNLKRLETTFAIPMNANAGTANYKIYVGPNEFDRLEAIGSDLEDIIPFGWSLFGTVNRWIIRPIFSFLSTFIGQAGLIILTLTVLIKLALYPLTYKMLHSQAKMQALKPRMAKLKEKFKDDAQAQQMETMKVYREYGVNPAGGCMPMVLQMPIWFALYRFFPASIEFRQKSFLWATDLSSYDVFAQLPFEIPFYGDHVSMFTLLWVVTTIIYTYYNSKMMDMGQMASNPALKYMQYGMPVMFLFFFNSFAAGLTVYLVFSNVFNIAQTVITKNWIINHEKIEAGLVKKKAQPKKKTGFGARLEEALKQQQAAKDKKA